MHNEIRHLIRQRRLHRKAKNVNTSEAWAKFRKIRNKVVGKYDLQNLIMKIEFQFLYRRILLI